jgi:hypothetical protein
VDYIYTVYTLTDGIADDIYAGDNYDDAYALYEGALGIELYARGRRADYTETTVHLYDAAYGNMLAEYCVAGR